MGTQFKMARIQYSIHGRRVQIADLINAGLLKSGDTLTLDLSQAKGTVTRDGGIRLKPGVVFRTPSRAASESLGGGSLDGWRHWQDAQGTSLAILRDQLLASVSSATPQTSRPVSTVFAHEEYVESELREFLKTAQQMAADGKPVRITVRRLLDKWGMRRRTASQTDVVRDDLFNYGLTTSPDFATDAQFDESVRLVAIPEVREVTPAPTSKPSQVPQGGTEPPSIAEEVFPMGVTLGLIVKNSTAETSVDPNSSLDVAVTKMRRENLDVLPVGIAHSHRGVVTWKSIATALHRSASPTLRSATVEATRVDRSRHLLSAVDLIEEHGCVAVFDGRLFMGVVTAADVAASYGALAKPFVLLTELDRLLRSIVSAVGIENAPESVRSKSAADLDFGDYQTAFGYPNFWEKLGWRLSREEFGRSLDRIRRFRNDVMHANSVEEADEREIQQVRNILDTVRDYNPGD